MRRPKPLPSPISTCGGYGVAEDYTHPRKTLQDVEALLFASDHPLRLETIIDCLTLRQELRSESVEEALAQLELEYPVDGPRGMELARVGGGWLFRTNRAAETVLAGLYETADVSRLSAAAMETLAVIAYLQPVSRRQVAEIRGVGSESPLRTLLERDLIQEAGRSPDVGQPMLYGTTPRFLVAFGLGSLADLPELSTFEVSSRDREELLRRLGALLAPE